MLVVAVVLCMPGVYHSLQQSGTGSPYVNSEIDVVAMAKTGKQMRIQSGTRCTLSYLGLTTVCLACPLFVGEVFFPCSATPDVNDFLASCFFRFVSLPRHCSFVAPQSERGLLFS